MRRSRAERNEAQNRGLYLDSQSRFGVTRAELEARIEQQALAWVTEVALALGNAPRLLRRWLTGSLLATAASALPLAASSSRQ